MEPKGKEITFSEGTAEDYLVKNTAIDKHILVLEHDRFTMRVDKDSMLFFDMHEDIGRALSNNCITDRIEKSISYVDIALSPKYEDSFSWLQEMHSNFLQNGAYTHYNKNSHIEQYKLMCFICYSYFISQFDDIKSISDITRPIPTPLFLNIVQKYTDIELIYKDAHGIEYAGILERIQLVRGMFGTNILLELRVVSCGKDGYVQGYAHFTLPYQTYCMRLEDLGLVPMTPEQKIIFTERGKKYIEYTNFPSYAVYRGFAFRPGRFWGDSRVSVNGRIMVDINAMRTLNSHIDDEWFAGNSFNNKGISFQKVDENKLWLCVPVIYGYSFANKLWIKMDINNLSPIQFSESAFTELIIPSEHKEIFIACLTNDMPSLDSIEGKGSGKIFLLYGAPGWGKTMTAESVAEYLKMPLYYVSVGELGTSPEHMESSLTDIMEIAQSWNAVVLLDEVDVFAVKRDSADLKRNAMTAILLRLLERYSGIMFMTTNLKDNLDPAFISRATATIEYKELPASDRKIIWHNLLKKVAALGVEIAPEVHESLDEFAAVSINGREIKNKLRLAYALAKSKDALKGKITKSILSTVMNINQQTS